MGINNFKFQIIGSYCNGQKLKTPKLTEIVSIKKWKSYDPLQKMVDFMDLEEDYNDISVRGAQRQGQKYHCNPTLSP